VRYVLLVGLFVMLVFGAFLYDAGGGPMVAEETAMIEARLITRSGGVQRSCTVNVSDTYAITVITTANQPAS